ncbi:MAG TPA: M48 family metalloprotease [Pyrinomonadaceae bacterium]|nr:M48 family metalloprotease [Pyrinomonadaceae bacterium]
MKIRPLQAVALLLAFVFVLPTPQLIALAQQPSASSAQEKSKEESSEEKKLREREEKLRKKEEKRKDKEAKLRVNEDKKYRTLNDFAQDLYAEDPEFRQGVDKGYSDLQAKQQYEAFVINVGRRRAYSVTDNDEVTVESRRYLYENPRIQEYVNRLGQQIVPEDSDKLYAFKIFVSPIPQAYTLSTGTVLLSTGLVSLLDNEAQLVYVLAHEVAHVYKDHWRTKVMVELAEEEYNRKQERRRMMWASVMALAGVGLGAAISGKDGAATGGITAGIAGYAISAYYSKRIELDWNVAQENEADDFAMKATLGRSFDIKEVPKLYATLAQQSIKDMRVQLGFIGARSRLRERAEYAQKLIEGSMQAQYQAALQGSQIKGLGPEFNLIMAELKRDNGIEAFHHDMFQMARKNLQDAYSLRSEDPLTLYYHGRVLKQVGRTKEELEVAQQSLIKAMSLDTRHEIPDAELHRALMLMDSKDSNNYPEAIAALKSYITTYGQKRALEIRNDQVVPSNLTILYGYLRLLGDKTWTAPDVVEVFKASTGSNPAETNPLAQSPPKIPRVEPASQTLSPIPVNQPPKP